MNWAHVAADTGFEQQFLTIGAASAELGVSRDTLRRWERAGKVLAHRLDGKNRYFRLRELLQLRDSRPMMTRQAARTLGVSESTVRRMADRGEIEATRAENGRRLYKSDHVREQVARPKHEDQPFCEPNQAIKQVRVSAETVRGLMAATGMIIILVAAYCAGHPALIRAFLHAPAVASVLGVLHSLDYR